jgi:hypothetical protein
MLSLSKTTELFALISAAQTKMSQYTPSTPLYYLEARYTLFKLSEIIRERNEESLQFFLLQRWTRIRNVNNHYLQDFTNPANEACIGVANILAEIVHKPYLILLMPTLAEVPPIHYTTSSY